MRPEGEDWGVGVRGEEELLWIEELDSYESYSSSDMETPCSLSSLSFSPFSSPRAHPAEAAHPLAGVKVLFVLGVQPAWASNFHYLHSSKLRLHHLPDLGLKKERSWP